MKGKNILESGIKFLQVNTISYKTISANAATVDKQWVVVDAEGQTLGRLSSKVAKLIRGKYKPNFTPHVDCGDHVIVINAEKIQLTGNKWEQKEYFSHTGYPGGQSRRSPRELHEKNPALLVEKAVRGMLPKNKLGRSLFKNLHVVIGDKHQHEGQKPKSIQLNDLK